VKVFYLGIGRGIIDLTGGIQMANTLMVIEPYWCQDTWVFDDASVGLEKEPFMQGIPEMIDYLVKDIPNLWEPRHA
jgi:hypothetical protein